ncbi:hypothetical protein J14TS5_03610 [Paenibacillus lautus]|uniref:CdiA C-terminal domain-containing protein n=1 Tax=Paenibacillus lautus TaxID=1401 RepID=UPI001B09E32D|nr:hypothetical protein [Paenibacillus lautus]GIO95275.1 hypothetical protein J14TS5_03610 [Paenibacillus lautus]
MKRWRDIDGFQIELPYELSAVRSFRIVRKFNDHTRCYISTTMSEEQADICLRNGTYRDSLLIHKSTGQGNEYLFAGGISNIDIQMEDGIPHVTIEGLSRTYEMDRHLESRSFQNKSLTYTDLIRQIANLYPGGDAQNEATPPEATIGQLLVQYEETNWQFLKRLASRIGTVILPDIVMDAPRVYFGVPDFSWGKVIRSHYYSIIKDRGNFLDIQANSDASSDLGESDFVSYRVHTNQYCQVGDNVSFKGQMWVVTESVITYESGLIYYEYVLMQRAALRRKVRTNRALQGVALEGRVIKRGNNMVKVHLDIDHDHDERGNWWFPYSPEGNNIFHCMPEKGARIKVYFPEGTEKKAIAINSVRGRNEEMKSRTVFQKPMTKVFHMPGAAKMELGEDGVLFEKNTVSLTLDGNDISLSATESILVVASNEIELGGQNMPEHIKLVANETITFFTNTDHYMEIRPEYVGIKGKKVSLEKVEMDFLDMLTDEELEKLYVDHELEVANKERKKNRRYISGFSLPAYHWTEEVQQKITNDAVARLQNPKTRGSAKESLKALGEDELQRRYKEKFIPPPPKPEKKSKKERAQEQQEYAEFYQGYIDIRSGKKAPPKQPTSSWKAVKAHIENQAKDNEVLQGLVNVSKALTGPIEKWGDRWEERREEHQLNELIPLVPDYLSKIPDEDIYFSRFTFEELVVKQQKLMTELNLMFGVVAFVGAFFTAGGSLYLLAAVNGVWGVAQMGVGFMKLQDLNDGVVSDTSLLGINQEMLDVTGLMLGAVDLAILGKTLLKGAKGAYNARYVKGVNDISPPKTKPRRKLDDQLRRATDEGKTLLNDISVIINPKNYEAVPVGQLSTGNGTIGGFKQLVRTGDEPLFMFSKSGGSGGIRLTEPSMPKGGKLTDKEMEMFTSKNKSPGHEKEFESARLLREEGYDIKILEELKEGNGFGIKDNANPDFIIEGSVFDCYAPVGDNLKNTVNQIQSKTKSQATRIILNLDNYEGSIDGLKDMILRKANPKGDLKYLDELLVIKDETIIRWFWREG